ncbi:MAG: hypothetical protein NTV51_05260 [Verrucomicrobia bacterium]|nr:hypothetical protein [Verrucomicrobiota bacterium]
MPHPCRTPVSARRRVALASAALLCLTASFARAQSLTPDSARQPETGTGAENPVQLNPFEVTADTKGYFSGNTISGTRINSKLEDLGAAITVMTKEQMSDFAMLDINDIFLYSVGTEGSGEYTDFAVNNNGQVADNVQNNPRGANRMRGIGSANISMGNIGLSGLTPVDPLNIEGVEISRGPNANVFGLGSPGGTLNMIPSTANVTKDRTQTGSRVDSLGGYRFDLDANRVLLKNRLALRVSAAFQHDGYQRKPSGTDTLRYNGMMRFQPYQRTTVTAGYSYYRMNGNRPNTLMPRDGITYWIQQGKPAWDPVTSTYTVNGVTYGLNGAGPAATRTAITSDNNIPDVFQRTFSGNDRSYVFIDQGAVAYWTTPTGNSANTPLANNSSNRYMAPSPAAGVASGKFTSQPLFTTTPTLSDSTYYDWSSVNLGAMNRLMDRTIVSTVQLQQVFFTTPRQQLAGQADWLREDSMRSQRNIFGTGPSNQILVDVNSRLHKTTAPSFPTSSTSPARRGGGSGSVCIRSPVTTSTGGRGRGASATATCWPRTTPGCRRGRFPPCRAMSPEARRPRARGSAGTSATTSAMPTAPTSTTPPRPSTTAPPPMYGATPRRACSSASRRSSTSARRSTARAAAAIPRRSTRRPAQSCRTCCGVGASSPPSVSATTASMTSAGRSRACSSLTAAISTTR